MRKKTTKGADYAERLRRLSNERWKTALDVQRPYRWNLKRLQVGKTLDIGCGIGRNLRNLPKDSVGVDHNEHAIKTVKMAGFDAYTVEEFKKKKAYFKKNPFKTMLLAHVLEHMSTKDGTAIIKEYLPFVEEKVVIICPQKRGFSTDETHVNYLTHQDIEKILESCGLTVVKSYSFPFYKKAGDFFAYNETVVVATK